MAKSSNPTKKRHLSLIDDDDPTSGVELRSFNRTAVPSPGATAVSPNHIHGSIEIQHAATQRQRTLDSSQYANNNSNHDVIYHLLVLDLSGRRVRPEGRRGACQEGGHRARGLSPEELVGGRVGPC